MPVNGLDHVNIQTRDLAATVQFFADVLELVPSLPPGELDPTRVTWMKDRTGYPLVHLTVPGSLLGDDGAAVISAGTGALHHIALDCSDHAATLARLERLTVSHRLNDVPSINLKQIFVTDPNGVLLELNFRGS